MLMIKSKQIKYIAFIAFLFIFIKAKKLSAQTEKEKDSTFVFIPDDPIVAAFDSLSNLSYFEKNAIYQDSAFGPGFTGEYPVFDDLTYGFRLAALSATSPFKLDYNDAVKSYIDMYSKRRTSVSRMLGLAKLYFPLFEQTLDKYNLPLELKYLSVIESALNPAAVSRAGATGLWQFMYPTGKMFGLNVNSYVDERKDVYKSTEAACKYFVYLYKIYGDWQLVLAAYNSGPGTVNKAIRRSGGKKTYWQIRPYLPTETQGYVPAFIAVTYLMNYTKEHQIYPTPLKTAYVLSDTIKVKQQVSFNQIAAVLNLPVEDIQYLNPTYKLDVIPYTGTEAYTLRLPNDKIGDFINNENAIYAYKTPEEQLKIIEATQLVVKDVMKFHKVRKGEGLQAIANKYDCTLAEIKEWNHLKSNYVKPGKKLVVYVASSQNNSLAADTKKLKDTKADTTALKNKKTIKHDESSNIIAAKDSSAKETGTDIKTPENNNENNVAEAVNPASKKYIYYTVQPGDTLWVIANKYKGTTISELKKLNKINGSKSLKPGTKIKVGIKA